MTDTGEAPGCRDATLVTSFLITFAIALFAIGLTLVNGDSCDALCETAGLTMLYAGGPVSAIFGVVTDSVVVAWPLDLTLWVILGFFAARLAANRAASSFTYATMFLTMAAAYGLVLSSFVELTV